MENTLLALNETHCRKESQHNVGRTLMDLKGSTDYFQIRRVVAEPSEKIEMDESSAQKVGSVETVAVAID